VRPKANIVTRDSRRSINALIPEDIQMSHTLFALVLLGAARLLMRRASLAPARSRDIGLPR
jgi:hypothetical protein